MNRTDARLIYSASESDANMLWATRFFAPDPFVFIEKRGRRTLVMNDLEIDRAKDQASVDKVLSYSDYVRRVNAKSKAAPILADVLLEIFRDLKISSVSVPSTFPLGLADQLRRKRVRVVAQPDPFWTDREIKTNEEVRDISDSLRAAEAGIEAGIAAIRRSVIRKDGYLYLDGTQLTSEILKRVINTTIMSLGFVPSHSIVASGDQCVDPHNEGSGPIRRTLPSSWTSFRDLREPGSSATSPALSFAARHRKGSSMPIAAFRKARRSDSAAFATG